MKKIKISELIKGRKLLRWKLDKLKERNICTFWYESIIARENNPCNTRLKYVYVIWRICMELQDDSLDKKNNQTHTHVKCNNKNLGRWK